MVTREPNNADVDRRALLLGVAGAAALVVAKSDHALAQEMKAPAAPKVIKQNDAMIPGYAKVRLREATWQPGEGIKTRPMPNDMVCEMASGSLDVVVDGKSLTRKTGDVWTCRAGMMIADANKGSTPAVMRIFDLLKA